MQVPARGNLLRAIAMNRMAKKRISDWTLTDWELAISEGWLAGLGRRQFTMMPTTLRRIA